MKNMFEEVWKYITSHIFQFFYITGLTFLVIFVATSQAPKEIWFFKNLTQETFLYVALALITCSIIGVFSVKRDLGKTFRSLGYCTIIPGLIAAAISFFGKDMVTGIIYRLVIVEQAKPLVDYYLAHSVPNLWFLSAVYVLVGILSFMIGVQLRKV